MEDHFLGIEQVKSSWSFWWTLRLRLDSAVVMGSWGVCDCLGLAMSAGGGARVLEMDKDSFFRELG